MTDNLQIYDETQNLSMLDLVVIDAYHRNAFDQIRFIRNNKEMFELPILVVSFLEDREKFYDRGLNDFITVPINVSQLRDKVDTILKTKSVVMAGIQKELNFFRSKISSHFLYNTMNTIIGLSYIDVEKKSRGDSIFIHLFTTKTKGGGK